MDIITPLSYDFLTPKPFLQVHIQELGQLRNYVRWKNQHQTILSFFRTVVRAPLDLGLASWIIFADQVSSISKQQSLLLNLLLGILPLNLSKPCQYLTATTIKTYLRYFATLEPTPNPMKYFDSPLAALSSFLPELPKTFLLVCLLSWYDVYFTLMMWERFQTQLDQMLQWGLPSATSSANTKELNYCTAYETNQTEVPISADEAEQLSYH
jgi:hypothetical protein